MLYKASGLYQEVMKVRKKGNEIIRPEGIEIREYFNDCWGICNSCGALMDEELRDRIGVFTCPACGWECNVKDYEYEEEDTTLKKTASALMTTFVSCICRMRRPA